MRSGYNAIVHFFKVLIYSLFKLCFHSQNITAISCRGPRARKPDVPDSYALANKA